MPWSVQISLSSYLELAKLQFREIQESPAIVAECLGREGLKCLSEVLFSLFQQLHLFQARAALTRELGCQSSVLLAQSLEFGQLPLQSSESRVPLLKAGPQ